MSSPFPIRRTKPKKRKRSAKDFKRIYGSKARVEWVKSLPCAACGVEGYSENAHVAGESGVGYKADAEFIAPLCGVRPFPGMPECDWLGCHRLFDCHRWNFDKSFPDFDADDAARSTNEAWLEFSSSPKTEDK